MSERITLRIEFVADNGTAEKLQKNDDWEELLAGLRKAYMDNKVLIDRVEVTPNY